jgi:hypothetical protein
VLSLEESLVKPVVVPLGQADWPKLCVMNRLEWMFQEVKGRTVFKCRIPHRF